MPGEVEIWTLVSAVALALAVFAVGMVAHANGSRSTKIPPYLPVEPGWGGMRVRSGCYNHWDFIAISAVIFFYLSQLGILALVSLADDGPKDEPSNKIGIVSIAVVICVQAAVTIFVCVMASRHLKPWKWLGLKWKLWPLVFVIAPIGVAMAWTLMIGLETVGFNAWLIETLQVREKQDVVSAFAEADSQLLLFLLSFMAVVVAPITEEIIFRGYIYPVAKGYAGAIPAAIFSAIIFSAIHTSMIAFVPLLVLALIMTLAYELTGSILAPISIHMLFNSATVILQILIIMEVIPAPEA